MKCINCQEKFPRKGTKRCVQSDARLCLRCNLQGQGKHRCDLDCANSRFPKINTYPLSSSVIGMSPTGEIKGTIDEFLPRGFHFVSCKVSKIFVYAEKMQKLNVSLDFVLDGASSLQKEIYSSEGWKWQHIENELKSREVREKSIIAPIFCLYLWEGLRVKQETVRLTLGSQSRTCIPKQEIDFIGLSDCFPPLTDKPKPAEEKYSFFVGKFTCFYAPFVLGEQYHLEFNLEAINFYYDIGFLFPYRYVDVEQVEYSADSPIAFPYAGQMIVNPIREDSFPPKQEYEWAKHKSFGSVDMRPWIVPADPFRKIPLMGVSEKPKMVDSTNNQLKDYSLLLLNFPLAHRTDKKIIMDVEVTETPLPVRVYDQMQRLPRYNDKLVRFDIVSFSKEPVEVEISSEILGYTDQEISNHTLPAIGEGKPSRIVAYQCPKLKKGVLTTVNQAVEATVKYEIFTKTGGERKLYERGTRAIKLLPHDMIIWAARDIQGAGVYDLTKLIGAWITPNDENGLLDDVRGQAKEYHPNGVLVGSAGISKLEQITSQVKALYDYLNEKSGISYVNQAFNFDFGTGAQRVLLPERVLKAKTGNCIDLTVLFASLMEGMGLNPYILLMPGHAFLGWGNKHDKNKMGFLETITLGRLNPQTGKKFTFEESFNIAKETFKSKFIMGGADNYIPLYSLTFSEDRYLIVDLEEVRQDGVHFFAT